MGMGIGITGAMSHAALFLLNPWANAGTPEFWMEVCNFMVDCAGGPMLLLSFMVALATRRQATA